MSGLDGFGVSIDAPPPLALVESAAAAQTPPPASLPFTGTLAGVEYHGASSAESLEAIVGRDGLDPVAVRLSDDAAHGLIAGDPGSGKSNLLRVLLYGLAHRYSHEELQIYLLDFKVGVEFKEFGPTRDDPTFLPHARVVSTRSSRAFGAEVLEHVARMSSQRYRSLPDGVRKLAELRAVAPDEQHPRVLLVIDEFQRLVERDDAFAHRSVAALKVLAEQGRAAGFHFLLATQALGDVGVGTTVAQMIDPVIKSSRLRIGMRLGLEEARYLMRPDNAAAASIHARGLAIINDREGAVAGNVLTKIALIENDEARAARVAEARVAPRAAPPRMFDGTQPAFAGESIDARPSAGAKPAIWLGAELRVDDRDPRSSPPVRLPFARDTHRHLAVIGSGAVSAVAMVQWALVGRLVQRPVDERPRVVLLDRLRDDEGLPDGAVDALAGTLAGRSANCADCSRAVERCWEGKPAVSAALRDTPAASRDSGEDPAVLERWSGQQFSSESLADVEARLERMGPGSSAVVGVNWTTGGGHAFNAVNHRGRVMFVDGQTGRTGPWPPRGATAGFDESLMRGSGAVYFR